MPRLYEGFHWVPLGIIHFRSFYIGFVPCKPSSGVTPPLYCGKPQGTGPTTSPMGTLGLKATPWRWAGDLPTEEIVRGDCETNRIQTHHIFMLRIVGGKYISTPHTLWFFYDTDSRLTGFRCEVSWCFMLFHHLSASFSTIIRAAQASFDQRPGQALQVEKLPDHHHLKQKGICSKPSPLWQRFPQISSTRSRSGASAATQVGLLEVNIWMRGRKLAATGGFASSCKFHLGFTFASVSPSLKEEARTLSPSLSRS